MNHDQNRKLINTPDIKGIYYETEVPDTLDLAERASLGINHFTMSISEKDDYEMYWGVGPWYYMWKEISEFIGYGQGMEKLGVQFGECNPPYMVMAWSTLQCCQPKAMEAMGMERLMCGSEQLLEREAKMVGKLASYIGKDGLYWVSADSNKPWLGPVEERPYAHGGGQGRMIYAMIIWYQRTGDPAWKERIDRMVEGLDRIVVHKEDYAYLPVQGWIPYEYFRSCYTKRGWKNTVEPTDEKSGEEGSLSNYQGLIPGALSNWYMLTGNEKALHLAGELVRFLIKPKFWADWKNGEYPGVIGAEHAHWTGHFHGYINTLRAILEYAIATNDTRLKTFVRDGYEWARQAQFARIGLMDGQGCACGRLIGLAVKLSYAGVGDYWEDVDLYIRNHGSEMQFTPEDIPFLEKLCEGKPPPSVHHPGMSSMSTEDVIKATIGGFPSVNRLAPFIKTTTHLCCSTHGNMGLFYAWDGTLRYQDKVARVNLLLNRASPWMDIDSYLPYEGKVVLKNKEAQEAFVRIPLWVDRKAIRCTRQGKEVPKVWFDNYLRFKDLRPKDVLTIEFPVEERTEIWTVPNPDLLIRRVGWPANEVHTCRFRGNTLVEIEPPLLSPLYQDRAKKYKARKAPMKKVTRYVTPLVLKW